MGNREWRYRRRVHTQDPSTNKLRPALACTKPRLIFCRAHDFPRVAELAFVFAALACMREATRGKAA